MIGAQPSPAPDRTTDDQLLGGLWWSDPEYPEWCGPLWHEYVRRKHEWNEYRVAVATVLRSAQEATS